MPLNILKTDFTGKGKHAKVADALNHIGRVINGLYGELGIDVYNVGDEIRFCNLWPQQPFLTSALGITIDRSESTIAILQRHIVIHAPPLWTGAKWRIPNPPSTISYDQWTAGRHTIYAYFDPLDETLEWKPISITTRIVSTSTGLPLGDDLPKFAIRLYDIDCAIAQNATTRLVQIARYWRIGDLDIVPAWITGPSESEEEE